MHSQAVTSSNGLFQNGLTTNGLYQNGIYQNGIYQNGIYQNGIYQNGIYQNGIYQNGIYQNGIYQNGIYQNGIYQNGIYQNGIYQNGIYQNGIYQNGSTSITGAWVSGLWSSSIWQTGSNADALRTNAYTRQFLQYVYACAMPSTNNGYATVLDPGGLPACDSDSACGSGFICSANHTCVVPLVGAIGVGVNADGTTWADSGTCDESCQRWVSACVLARTNAYGVHVDISMRAPKDAPAAVQQALAVSDDERATYTLREGAYYGNVFETQPVNPLPAGSTYTGAVLTEAAPVFYACAGPGSNIPDITKRFCSSQGDQSVIAVPGVCLATGSELPACASEDTNPASPTFGAMDDCYPSTAWTGLTPYKEVITVYLKQPVTVCGNGICESGEMGNCAADCHTGGWNNNFATAINAGPTDGYNYVVAPDDSIVLVGAANKPILSGCPTTGTGPGAVAKLGHDGSCMWETLSAFEPNAIGVGVDGTFAVVGRAAQPNQPNPVGIGKVSADGAMLPGWPIAIGGSSASWIESFSIQTDRNGNVVVGGWFRGTATFGTCATCTMTTADPNGNPFIVMLSPAGVAQWAATYQYPAGAEVAFDPAGDVIVRIGSVGTSGYGLFKLAGATGTELWKKHGEHSTVSIDGDGNVWSAGSYFAGKFDFTLPLTNFALFMVEYASATGDMLATKPVILNCSAGAFCAGSYVRSIAFAGSDDVVLGVDSSGTVDVGAGAAQTYATSDLFIVDYARSTLDFRWAKHVPYVVNGYTWGVKADSTGRIVAAGAYTGSMVVDEALLVDSIPELAYNYNTYVASFTPPVTDTQPPVIGDAIEQTGMHLSTIPQPIVVEATSSAGATVFFMPPTAIDPENAGTNVICSPAPNTKFPIGTTNVTCTATDVAGHSSAASFTVTVRDTLAPTMLDVPADFTSTTNAIAYTPPTAIDQVDGTRPVTCTPASGTVLANGDATVTCSASDLHGHSVQASFKVTVHASDATPPVIAAPTATTAEATGPNGAVVTYPISAADDVDGPVAVACAPASGSLFALGTTTVHCSAHDAAGNVAAASFTIGVVDTTPPRLTLPSTIAATATSASGAVVTYAASASDVVDGNVATSCSPASGAQFAPGTTTVTCAATDAHGNRATGSFPVAVAFAWSGVLQPINADGSSIFKFNSTIPVKFQLTGASAPIDNLTATLQVAQVSSNVTGTYVEANSNGPGDSGNTFRYDATSATYIFNLSTKTLSVGTWSLQIVMPDGATRTVTISLR